MLQDELWNTYLYLGRKSQNTAAIKANIFTYVDQKYEDKKRGRASSDNHLLLKTKTTNINKKGAISSALKQQVITGTHFNLLWFVFNK